MDKNTRIVFMGTPSFGVKALQSIVANGYNIVGVFTQIDKPRNHLKVEFCPIKREATKLNLPVYQFEKLRCPQGVQTIKDLKPDLIVTAAFGQILSQEILDIPKFGVFNIHASLLPKYRGGCPIQWAIINGETESGITIMRTVLQLDAGDIILKRQLDITEDTFGSAYDKLGVLGAQCILQVLESDKLTFVKQDQSQATYFPVIKKLDGDINWNSDAKQIDCLIRGLNPTPTAYTLYQNSVLKIFKAEVLRGEFEGCNGQVLVANPKEGLIVKCGYGALKILELQLPSKKRMQTRDFLLGNTVLVGTTFASRQNNE